MTQRHAGGQRADEQRARDEVRRLEVEARDAPGRYRLRLLALALLGYGVVLGLLLLALAPFVLVAVHLFVNGASLAPQHVFVLVLPAAVAAVILRTLWVRFEPPAGHRLVPGEAPRLQATVERLRREMGAPALDGILIDEDFNAKAASVPVALGLLGHRHYLVLGWPLMQVLDEDAFASVIAHEFGHFGAHDGRFAAWIYLARGTWYRLRDGMAAHDFSFAWLLARFYAWFAPRFDLASRALTRRHEYAADAAAARAVGVDATADALLRIEIASRRLHARFWPRFWARARSQRHPPVQVLSALAQAAQGREVDLDRLLGLSARAHDPRDTHPALPQRLEALGASARPHGARGHAALDLLGPLRDTLERRLDDAWREAIRGHWEATYEAAAGDRARLVVLEGIARPTPDELAEHALLVEQVRIDVDPLPFYARALAADPDRVMPLFRAGLWQLRHGDLAGGERLRRAVALDPGAAGPAIEDLRALAADPDLDAATFAVIEQVCDGFRPLADAQRDDDDATGEGVLLPHDLDADALQRLARKLAFDDRVARAWVARRRTALREAPPQYLVLLDWRGSVAGEAAGLRSLAEALGSGHALFTGTDQKALARQVRAVCAEPVYRKGAH